MPTLAENRRTLHDYTIIDTLEAGIVLTGPEVKSLKSGHASLKAAYVTIKNNEAYLINTHISPYAKASQNIGYDPVRDRKLLLTRREIARVLERKDSEGLTAVPMSIFTKGDLIKVKIALARGRKHYEKRDAIKKREIDREIRRVVR
jgi:SsrA-binding protein